MDLSGCSIMRKRTLVSVVVALAGCAHNDYIPGTTVMATEENGNVLQVVEQYRERLIEKNVEGLLVLASERYFEDSGTPRADDDYGYAGLKDVLIKRLARLRTLRYEIQYRNVRLLNNRAEVEVFLNGAFELAADSGDRYRRVSDYHRFVLERSPAGKDRVGGNDKWKFVSGM
jgi:hypothetical protein